MASKDELLVTFLVKCQFQGGFLSLVRYVKIKLFCPTDPGLSRMCGAPVGP